MTHLNMKIAFMGTSDFAVPAVRLLIEEKSDLVCVITRPDRPKGRGRKLTAPPVKESSQHKGYPLFQPCDVKDESFIAELKELKPDVIVVVSYGQILSEEILCIPRFGCVNLHPSLLPRYRGAAPINWAIINGERATGITTMLMDSGMDSGDILLQRVVEIEENDTGEILHDRLAVVGAELLMETLRCINEDSITPIPQDHSKATVAPRLKKDDGLIDWAKSNIEIANLVRGLIPWPGAYTHLQDKVLKIFKTALMEGDSGHTTPGTIAGMDTDSIAIATGNGFLLLEEIQLQDHKRMNVMDFLRGHRHKIHIGTVLK